MKRRISTSTFLGNWKKLRNMEVTIILIVIGDFCIVTKGLLKGLGSWRTSEDHPNYSVIENGQKSPGDLRRLHHHLVVSSARIFLTLSRHLSKSFSASVRSSGLHRVSSQSCCIDTIAAWNKLRFILSVRSEFHSTDSLLIAVHAFVNHVLMSVSVDETLLPR